MLKFNYAMSRIILLCRISKLRNTGKLGFPRRKREYLSNCVNLFDTLLVPLKALERGLFLRND
ncbi:Hypothetical protein LLKF_1777 [Lactococcus lactis subsp. lactis KF147]|nr:Hypothetical protein LLKF_1777 [Lactococcus lactis subsp. lactis KF147]